jgi:hypothetical protein
VLSDGGWADTQAGVQRIRWLAEHAVPTIHLSIGIAPLSVECDRITVITDPADALDHITDRHRRRAARPPAPGATGDRRPATGDHAAPRPAAVRLLHSVEATAPGSGSS